VEERNDEGGGGLGGDQRLKRVPRWRKEGGWGNPCVVPHDGRSTGARVATAGGGRPAPTQEQWARAALADARRGFKTGEGALTGGAAQHSAGRQGQTTFKLISNQFKLIQTFQNRSNFDRSKKYLLGLKNFKIKYGFEDFKEINNFIHRSYFKFEVDF
jgi:hypothetical protein